MVFLVLTLLASYLLWRGRLFEKRWLLWVFVFTVPLPYVANQLGWVAAEVGRQPWVVYGLLRTADAYSPTVPGSHVLASMVMFSVVYALLFALYIFVLNHKIQQGPDDPATLPAVPPKGGLLNAAAQLLGRKGSMTETSSRQAPGEKE